MDKPDVEKLARLARLELSEKEKDKYSGELANILEYVKQVQFAAEGVDLSPSYGETDVKNVFRDDDNGHESGAYSSAIMREAPRSKDGFIQVKKILDNE